MLFSMTSCAVFDLPFMCLLLMDWGYSMFHVQTLCMMLGDGLLWQLLGYVLVDGLGVAAAARGRFFAWCFYVHRLRSLVLIT